MEPVYDEVPVSASVEENRRELDELFSLVYEELRRLAAAMCKNEAHSTRCATELVHEAWIRLKDNPQLAETTPLHFKRIAARVIRHVLIDAARSRAAGKRGGPGVIRITLDESLLRSDQPTLDLLCMDELLDQMDQANPRLAQLTEMRIFSELTNAEIAKELNVSLSTVERGWRLAKAWLKAALAERSERDPKRQGLHHAKQ